MATLLIGVIAICGVLTACGDTDPPEVEVPRRIDTMKLPGQERTFQGTAYMNRQPCEGVVTRYASLLESYDAATAMVRLADQYTAAGGLPVTVGDALDRVTACVEELKE